MTDITIAWLQAHPLQGVAALAAFATAFSLALLPALGLISRHGHPRC